MVGVYVCMYVFISMNGWFWLAKNGSSALWSFLGFKC